MVNFMQKRLMKQKVKSLEELSDIWDLHKIPNIFKNLISHKNPLE